MKWFAVVVNLLVISIMPLAGQNFARLDSLFDLIELKSEGMGNISIFKEGREVYQRNYGPASIDPDMPSDPHTGYRIGSITKTFTSVIIMQLVEYGNLTLDTRLVDFFPQIKNAGDISIWHLLGHQSGIFNITNQSDYFEWNKTPQSREDLVQKMVESGSDFAPGEKADYSNSNYILLTFIAEDVSGLTYAELLEKFIVNPLTLSDTYVGEVPLRTEAVSYSKLLNWKVEDFTDMSVPRGAGNIISTPTDVNTMLHHLFKGQLVSAVALEQMQTLDKGFGLGLFEVPFYEKSGIGHTGGIDGFQSNAFYFPEDKMSIAIMANGVSYPLNDIVVAALSAYFERAFDLPVFETAKVLSTEMLSQYTGVYRKEGFPLDITISVEDNTLLGQGSGQPKFPLSYVSGHLFKFEPAALTIEFVPDTNVLHLKQGGMLYVMTRISR